MSRRYLWLVLLLFAGRLFAAELSIDLGGAKQTWTTETLLARPDVRTVTIADDVAFHRSMQYRAVPLAGLLPGLQHVERLQFVASDGFSVDIDRQTLDNRAGAQAWLAIEDARQPWPALPGGKGGAGPFYLVWTHPEAAHVSSEQWPYQLAKIKVTDDMAVRFPATAPAAGVPADSPVRLGYAVFQRTCFACHTLNGEGDARMGPDLNIPHNPTEYFGGSLLRAFIRDPQSLRRWPQAKMSGFPTQALSDADLDAVVAYLQYMSAHKVRD
jgi:mono/diheme cytochrome c family protein